MRRELNSDVDPLIISYHRRAINKHIPTRILAPIRAFGYTCRHLESRVSTCVFKNSYPTQLLGGWILWNVPLQCFNGRPIPPVTSGRNKRVHCNAPRLVHMVLSQWSRILAYIVAYRAFLLQQLLPLLRLFCSRIHFLPPAQNPDNLRNAD